jgi:hypothetical protein
LALGYNELMIWHRAFSLQHSSLGIRYWAFGIWQSATTIYEQAHSRMAKALVSIVQTAL